jgi:uncharacterized repeat protein (TIGR01451 family)
LLALWLIAGLLLGPFATLPARASEAPIPLAPADGITATATSHPPLGIPEFSWQPVLGATKYRLQFSQDVGFAAKFEYETTNLSYSPTDANKFPDGIWYWRVRVEMPAPPSEYSTIMSFTKQWASPDNAPALTDPAADATLDFYDLPAFTWQPVMGAASYRFQIAASADGFASPRYTQIVLGTTHQPLAKLTNGVYYWRVVPLDPSGREGTTSDVRSFTADYNRVPTLLEPADNAFPTFTPTFRWTAVRGAQYYQLQYSTDPTFNTGVTTISTRNTTYTPLSELPNDVNYYWRVRTYSGASIADWSQTRRFKKQWYIQPELLTPTNNYQYVSDPFFSWTPVPGAASYRVEINCTNSFPPSTVVCGWIFNGIANPFFVLWPQNNRWMSPGYWYWRVIPIDGSNSQGRASQVFSFVYAPTTAAPQLVHPLYYYPPNDSLHPHEDRTVALPVFMWHRAITPAGQAPAYRLQVDDDPLFGSVNWTLDTENLSAAPTTAQPFTPTAGVDYYWRVRSLDRIGGSTISDWSQRWKTRIDTTLPLAGAGLPTVPPTTGDFNAGAGLSWARLFGPTVAPTLLRPAHGSESVETTPLLEWWPLAGAASYDVQISSDPDFGAGFILDAVTVPYPAYTPAARLAYGTYYWRVRGRSNGAPTGDWSAAWRFQVAAQSYWQRNRTLGDPANQMQIGADPGWDIADANYDLTTLAAVQSEDYWYFGFNALIGPANAQYGLYLDLDHADTFGSTAGDPQGYQIATVPAHRPEYAIYFSQDSGLFNPEHVAIYRWTGDTWAAPQTLAQVGGSLHYSPTIKYVELQVPNTAIGMEETTGSAAISLFSVPAVGGHAQDTVPSDPNVAYPAPDFGPGVTTLSRFASVSERLTPVMPPNNATGDPTVLPTVKPFFWHLPVWVFWKTWYGFNFQAAVDPQFTSVVWDFTEWFTGPTRATPSHTHDADLEGDNTYYWRVRPVYEQTANARGAWSQPWRFERQGFVPQNIQTSVTFATPTFSWDVVEGAGSYELQVDNDPGFGSLAVWATTTRNSHTPVGTLAQGQYYWRVRVKRSGFVTNDWTPSQTFTLTLPYPADLHHPLTGIPGLVRPGRGFDEPIGVVSNTPTLCWTPLLASESGIPVLAAWKYRIQVSRDPTFSTIYDTADTEQACWTSTRGYDDGTYYWRVAIMDGEGRVGDYSTAATFTKQYPAPGLVSPDDGATLAETPTFIWQPAQGAAKYKLEVSLYPTFAPVYDSVTTNSTRYTPVKSYTIGQTYYWRVAMVDKDGKQGPFSQHTTTVSYADLTVSVRGPATARPGETITYTITYTNLGRAPADGVRVSDTLPSGVTSTFPTTWEIGRVAAGASGSVVLTATLGSALACGVTLINVASVTVASAESDTSNNEARSSTAVVCPDLLISVNGPVAAQPGETITYTLFYNNVGQVAADRVRISDTLPPGVTSSITPVWEIGTVPAGTTGSRAFTATMAAALACGTQLVNTARIAAASSEPDLTNNVAQNTTVVVCPDLALSVRGPATAAPGETITYTLAYTNAGNAAAAAVRISDTLPLRVYLKIGLLDD